MTGSKASTSIVVYLVFSPKWKYLKNDDGKTIWWGLSQAERDVSMKLEKKEISKLFLLASRRQITSDDISSIETMILR